MPVAPARAGRTALPILEEADRLLEGWSCDCSAECCDFELTGREPYVTAAEFALLSVEVARQGRRMPAPRRDGRCPFLDDASHCTVYASRPFGCRTFFCDRATGWSKFPRREIAALPRMLEDLSVSAGARAADAKGRPLTRWL